MGDDKQVSQKTSLKNKPSGLIKNESWYGVTEAVCNVRSAPSTKSSVVAQYGKGEKIYYDSVYEGDGYPTYHGAELEDMLHIGGFQEILVLG